jgi:glutamate-5-semialdehyde dehydrogenase
MDTHQLAHAARLAARPMATLDSAAKNNALLRIAADLQDNSDLIFAANRQDVARSTTEGLAEPLLKRLNFGKKKLEDVAAGLRSLTKLPDPVGRTQLATRLDNGLDLYRVSSPIGVIGVIFESRPDALVQIASLCLKSGNCVLLKGGSEARETNRVLAGIIEEASLAAGMPAGWLGLLESRTDVSQLLTMDKDVDLIIPRGSNEFVRHIMENTHIPVLGHADGVCHLYLDAACDPAMAIKLAIDGKTQYVAVCNATETILIHSSLADTLLPSLAETLRAKGVEIFGCSRVCSRLGCQPVEEWHHEYLDLKVSLKMVDNLDEAIHHINQFGSGHTDAIVTADASAARRFLQEVDSGSVFWNCSTRFSDGFNYGFGAEVGISTGKFHARGPVGLEGLLTYQYRLIGHGHAIADYASGSRHFKHETLNQPYPLQDTSAANMIK